MKKSNIVVATAFLVATLSSFMSVVGVKKAYSNRVPATEEAGLTQISCGSFKQIRIINNFYGNLKIIKGSPALFFDDNYKDYLSYEVKDNTLIIDFSKSGDNYFGGRTVVHCPTIASIEVADTVKSMDDKLNFNGSYFLSGFSDDTVSLNLRNRSNIQLEGNKFKYLKLNSENLHGYDAEVQISEDNQIAGADIRLSKNNVLILNTFIPDLNLNMDDSAFVNISGKVQKQMMKK